MPTAAECRSTANYFLEKYGIPNIAVGVDGKVSVK